MVSKMAPDLLNQISNEFRGDTLNTVASTIGETPVKTQGAIGAGLAAILGMLASKASTTDGASEILNLIRRNNLDTGAFGNVASAVTAPNAMNNLTGTGSSLMTQIFGARFGAVTDWLGSNFSLNRTTSTTLLSILTPLALAFIGRRVGAGGATQLTNLLGKPRSYLEGAGAGLAGILGAGEPVAATARSIRSEPERYVTEPAKGTAWWKWVLPLAVLGLLGLFGYLLSQRQEPVATVTQPSAPVAPAPVAPAPAPVAAVPSTSALGAFIDKSLPNGLSLHIPSNGVESKLLAFIDDKTRGVDKETWFSFDRLEFDTDSATLKPSSQEQVRNISEILKAYPAVSVKIGGYTDNTGNPAHNLKLSQDRAASTANEIAKLGVNKSRLAWEGYGEQHPVADNSTEEGRQRNRRIDIRVTKK